MESLLRDLDREAGKMQADVEKLHRHYENWQLYVRQYIQQTTVEWAKLVLSHPLSLLLIVETTPIVGKDGCATTTEHEPIRLTAFSLFTGKIIYDQLIHPSLSQGVKGHDHHGLLASDLVDQPRLAEAWTHITELLEGHPVIIFGADWACEAISTVVQTHVLDGAFCLHGKSKEFYGEFYELSLEKICSYQGIDKRRDQLKDSRERVLVLAQVLHNLAQGMPKQVQETQSTESMLDDEPLDLDSHPF
jgi:DNA polymerase III epsilon subunit-like protein